MSMDLYHQIANQLESSHGVVAGQMFGKPCLKTGGKAFAAFFKEAMVFKLGREEIALVMDKYPGAALWDPSGKKRPMKDWMQVPREYHENWLSLAHQALEGLTPNS
ncbi:MAG: hypothetical protein ACFB10_17600 [Salibacteraceae bacterium]